MWPMSRNTTPKHFLPIFDGKSLFQINYEILREQFKPEEIYLQTNLEQAKIAQSQCPEIIVNNCFIEPEVRDTGPALGMTLANLYLLDPDEPYFYIQADLLRLPKEKYLETIHTCDRLIQADGKIITGGEKPKTPTMGIDYLKTGLQPVKSIDSMKVYTMEEWLGRDSEESVIESFIKQDSVMMHWNHNTATPRIMLNTFQKYQPDWYRHVMNIINALEINDPTKANIEFCEMEKGPMENVTKYALKEGYVIELPYRCIDFGTWASLRRYEEEFNIKADSDQLITIGSAGSFVKAPPGKMVALIGVNNLTVIDTPNGLLVCNNNETGKVGEVVTILHKQGKTDYL